MGSHWKRIAEAISALTTSSGSHKKRVATTLEATGEGGTSWADNIRRKVGVQQTTGSHAKRMTPFVVEGGGESWPERLHNSGTIEGALTSAPINTSLPVITGTVHVGETLSVSNGVWDDGGAEITGYTYQWKADGGDIGGAISSTYMLTSGEVGTVITCTVTATNAVDSTPVTSEGTAAVISAPVNTGLPVISGTAQSGETLSVTNGTWDDGGSAISGYTYQWKADDVNISGAKSATYALTDDEVGAIITCEVTATNAVGSTAATSEGTDAVASGGLTVEATNTSTEETVTLSHTVALPPGIVAGDMLVVFFVRAGTGSADNIATPSGWTRLFTQAGWAQERFYCFYKVADGGEGSTLAVEGSTNRRSAHNTYRISGHQGAPEHSVTIDISTTPDSPPLSPSWGSANTLWLSAVSVVRTDGHVADPANYTNRLLAATSAGDALCASIRRELEAASENPGAWQFSQNGGNDPIWIAATIAVQPS